MVTHLLNKMKMNKFMLHPTSFFIYFLTFMEMVNIHNLIVGEVKLLSFVLSTLYLVIVFLGGILSIKKKHDVMLPKIKNPDEPKAFWNYKK